MTRKTPQPAKPFVPVKLAQSKTPRLGKVTDPALRSDLAGIIRILGTRRAPGTRSHEMFCRAVLEPVFGAPDASGNYVKVIGDRPDIAFLAHHDTVEYMSGQTMLHIDRNLVISLDPSDKKSMCLGADDGAGVWLILEMIKAGVPGLYVIFADEESGCIGSSSFTASDAGQALLQDVTRAVSFDRHNMQGPQVVTHMVGMRTCSAEFGVALSEALGSEFAMSSRGSVTDSLELLGQGGVCEATNISVGYYDHHSRDESLDFRFLRKLRDRLVKLDWTALPVSHDPFVSDYAFDTRYSGTKYALDDTDIDVICDIVQMYPGKVADLLASLGYDKYTIAEALAIERFPDTFDF